MEKKTKQDLKALDNSGVFLINYRKQQPYIETKQPQGSQVTQELRDVAYALHSLARRPLSVQVDGKEIGNITSQQLAREIRYADRMSGYKYKD